MRWVAGERAAISNMQTCRIEVVVSQGDLGEFALQRAVTLTHVSNSCRRAVASLIRTAPVVMPTQAACGLLKQPRK